MASNTPFSYSQSFTDPLNQTNTPQTPLFSTQISPTQTPRPPLFSTENVEENSPEASREVRRRWSVPEDGVLVSAWLNTSKDAIVGNDQKAGTFWKRVAAYYAASPAVKDLPKREWNTCKQRWGKINESVLKFCGCYEHAQRQRSSGQSEDDIFEMAYNLYFQDQRSNFTLEHAWRVLRNDQKWCSVIRQKGKSNSKRIRLDESGAHSSSTNTASEMEEQSMERPMGVKASKAKGKKSVKATNEERAASSLKALENIWAIKEKDWIIKEKDFAIKERLSKQKLLESLIGKTEPLSEMEITLKNKLISEILL